MLSCHIFNSSLHSSLPSFAQQQPPQPPTRNPQSPRLCRNSSASHNPASRAPSTKQPHRQLCSTTSLHLLPILPPTRVLTSPEPQVSNHNPNFPLPRTKQPHSKSKNGHPKTSNSGRQITPFINPQPSRYPLSAMAAKTNSRQNRTNSIFKKRSEERRVGKEC